MAHQPSGFVMFPGSTGRAVRNCKSLLLLAMAVLALDTGMSAFALTSTTTTLAVTSSGSAVTTVPALTVVTLTATAQAGSTPLTVGQVNFCDATATYCTDIHILGTAQLTSAGTAVLKFRPGIGSHSYKAVFLGTKTFAGSFSGDSALTVTATGKYITSTTIKQSGTFGSYSLTATVTEVVSPSFLTSPTGTVSFLDTSNGDAVLASAALGTGSAALNWVSSALPGLGSNPATVVVADFNGDGIPDLAIESAQSHYSSSPNQVSLYLGNGDGTFNPVASPSLIGTVSLPPMVTADFNGDGIPDLAIASNVSSDLPTVVSVELGIGDGTFQSSPVNTTVTASIYPPSALAVADFNGDGIPDLALTNAEQDYVTILLGNGDGTFSAVAAAPATVTVPYSIAVGDFNGDGIPDLAVTGLDQSMTILLGNGDGTFTAAASPALFDYPTPALFPEADLVVADFNGDGKADIAVSTNSGLEILLGSGDGTFIVPEYPALQVSDPASASIVVGDFNGDGNADLAQPSISPFCVSCPETLDVLLGNGDGTFTVTDGPAIGANPSSFATGDFNGDGVSDIAVTDYNGQSATALLAQPSLTATATASTISLTAYSGTHLVEASYPGDGNYNSSVSNTTSLTTTANLSLSAISISFGNEQVGYSTAPQNVMLTNTGGAAVPISSIGVAGASAASFQTSNTCGGSLAAGATCRVGVRFAPGATGGANAAIALNSSLGATPQNIVALSGTGVNAGEASVALSANSLSLGSEPVGYSTDSQDVIVTNSNSTAVLYFKSIALTGANALWFVTSNTCGGSVGGFLNPGASCRIGARFVPSTGGAASATVILTDNAPDSPQSITLSGTGISAPAASMTLSANSLAFVDDENVGTTTAAQDVTVTNTSTTATLYFGTITLGGANPSSFVTSNTCNGNSGNGLGGSLAPGASCRIGARFAPKASGPLSATITVTGTAINSPQTITLTGTGN